MRLRGQERGETGGSTRIRRARLPVAAVLVGFVVVSLALAACGDDDGADSARSDADADANGSDSEPTDDADPAESPSASAVDTCGLVPVAELEAVADGSLRPGRRVPGVGDPCIYEAVDDLGGSVYVHVFSPGKAFLESLQAENPGEEAVDVGDQAFVWLREFSSEIAVLDGEALFYVSVDLPGPSLDEVRERLIELARAAVERL